MQRIKAHRDRVRPALGTDPTRRHLPKDWGKYRGEYPPDDGSLGHKWSRNVICVPCRYGSRFGGNNWSAFLKPVGTKKPGHWAQLCPTCRSPLLCMPMTWSMPRKQDKWWTSTDATGRWTYHLAGVEQRRLREEHERAVGAAKEASDV